MKKTIFAFLLVSLLVCFGMAAQAEMLRGYNKAEGGYQYIAFGKFPQDADGTVKPILWRVLEVNEEYAYLLSEYVLFGNRIDPDDKFYEEINGSFNQTELYRLLNGPFEGNPISKEEQEKLNEIERLGYVYIAENAFLDTAFTDEEREFIYKDEELGCVFLPSADDLKNNAYGFASSKARMGYGTQYAYETGLFEYQNHSSPYWTRSQSISYPYATRCTKVDGDLGYIRCVVMNEGCRPAIRLLINEIRIDGGDGSIGSPFTVVR